MTPAELEARLDALSAQLAKVLAEITRPKVGFVGQASPGSVGLSGAFGGSQAKHAGLLDYASDPDGDPVSFEIVSQPKFGTLVVDFDGAFVYTPNPGFVGTDSFTWRAWAGGQPSNVATVTLNIAAN